MLYFDYIEGMEYKITFNDAYFGTFDMPSILYCSKIRLRVPNINQNIT